MDLKLVKQGNQSGAVRQVERRTHRGATRRFPCSGTAKTRIPRASSILRPEWLADWHSPSTVVAQLCSAAGWRRIVREFVTLALIGALSTCRRLSCSASQSGTCTWGRTHSHRFEKRELVRGQTHRQLRLEGPKVAAQEVQRVMSEVRGDREDGLFGLKNWQLHSCVRMVRHNLP